MTLTSRSTPALALGMLFLGGCCFPARDNADLVVHGMANTTMDLQPLLPADKSPPPPPPIGKNRLTLPNGLPGANAEPIALPDPKDPKFEQKKKAVFDKLYPAMPELGPDPVIQRGPNGVPLALADLQRLATSNSPLIRQAAADVEAARGAVIKAGAYPNPTVGLEVDNVGSSSGTPGLGGGYQGGFIDQLIKTAGKLRLAEAAARMDLFNAELALRRAQTDLTTQVRSNYFQVLVALESNRINKLLVKFTEEAFRVQLEQAKAGAAASAAPYEPMQLRVLAHQARIALNQARNGYTTAWKQLAATMGVPAMPGTAVAGRADMPIPRLYYDRVLARVLNAHTDVGTAHNGVLKARYNLRLAQVTPIPDVDVRGLVQKDYTSSPNLASVSVQVSVPIPIWDHNKGGIVQAQGQLLRATEEAHRVRDALTFNLADAFNRYDTNLKSLEKYKLALEDQVRVYRGVYERHQQQPDIVGFGDIVTAQQTLAGLLASYIQTLGLEWQALVDVANLMQTDDLFQMRDGAVDAHCNAIADLEHLKPLSCCHRSSPLLDPRLKGADGSWPGAFPAPKANEPKMPSLPEKEKASAEAAETSQVKEEKAEEPEEGEEILTVEKPAGEQLARPKDQK